MDSCIDVIVRSYEFSEEFLTKVLGELTQEEAAWRPGPECNNIIWILWHFTRGEDNRVNVLIQHGKELYETDGWQKKLGTPSDRGAGNTLEQIHAWPVPKLEIIRGYHDSVYKKALVFIKSLSAENLSEVVQPNERQSTTGAILAVRISENAMHIGQIAYLRGIQRGINK